MPRQVVNSPAYDVPVRESADQAPFSQAIVVPAGADFVFVSGITSRAADGAILHEGDIEAQTRQVLENLRAILAAAGAGMGDVIKTTTFVRNADDIRLVSRLRREAFGDPPPTSSTVEVSRLFDPRQLIEIEAIAAVRRG